MKAGVFYIIAGLITVLASFVNLYLITDFLLVADFELYVKTLGIYIFCDPIVSVQLPGAITRFFYDRKSLSKKDDLLSHVVSSVIISFSLSFLVALVGGFLGVFSANVGILLFGNFISRSAYAYFRIQGQAKVYLFQAIFEALFLLFFSYTTCFFKLSWEFFIINQGLSYIASTLVIVIFFTDFRSKISKLRILSFSKVMTKYSFSLVPYHYSSISIQHIEKLLLPVGQNWGVFFFVDRFKNLGFFFINKLNDMLSPKYFKSAHNGDLQLVRKINYIYFVIFLAVLVCAYFSKYFTELIFLFFSEEYNSKDVPVYLSIMILSVALRVLFLRYSNDLFLEKTANKLSLINFGVAFLFVVNMFISEITALFVLNLRLIASLTTIILMFLFNKSNWKVSSLIFFLIELFLIIIMWLVV